jgi:hypothetical protein
LIDESDRFIEVKKSELNDRLSLMANLDQTGRAFIQNSVMTMLNEGACALVPIEVSSNPKAGTFEILSIRVGTITEWFSYDVRVSVYNELIGDRVEIMLPKSFVAIPYNPFYSVMNESTSTLRRLKDKLALLDSADGRLYSQKLDLLLQLPYVLKGDKREEEATRRLRIIEDQLYESKYGIAYTDINEKVIQLNRPVTNTLLDSVDGLKKDLYNELGLTESIVNGTADDEAMIAYINRTIVPIIDAITEAMIGTFFTRTAIRQGNTIRAFPNLFKMVGLEKFSEASDKLTRNAIMSSNEIRGVLGLKPDESPDSDSLRNKNLNQSENDPSLVESKKPDEAQEGENNA